MPRFFLHLLLLISPTTAMITVLDEGQRYASRQDSHYGPLLWKGYQYMSRLQVVPNHLDLCETATNLQQAVVRYANTSAALPFQYTLTIPSDNLPITLLVRQSDQCSLPDQVQFLHQHVVPLQYIKYLILDGGTRRRRRKRRHTPENRALASSTTDEDAYNQADEDQDEWEWEDDEEEEEEDDGKEVVGVVWNESNTTRGGMSPPLAAAVPMASSSSTTSSSAMDQANLATVTADRLLEEAIFVNRRHSSAATERDEVTVPYTVLHVSSRTHVALLDMLVHQTAETHAAGGPRIIMDSRLGTHVWNSSTALWIACSALMGACCCSFLLLISGTRAGWWDVPDVQAPAPTTRQTARRRLTKEQVRRLFPVYQFNGTCLERLESSMIPPSQEPSTTTTPLLPDVLQQDQAAAEEQLPPMPQPLELSLCSICLDEYEPGDRIRCLEPCCHAFHSRCIGKWLSERSATCPLCKVELGDPEEPLEEENTEENNVNVANATREVLAALQQEAEEEPPATDSLWTFATRVFGWQAAGDAPSLPVTTADVTTDTTAPVSLELDNASTDQEQARRGWLWRRLRTWGRHTEDNHDDDEAAATNTLTQPLLNAAADPLMVPLEATTTATTTTSSVPAITTATTTSSSSLTDNATTSTATTTAAPPSPDPPGPHARQVSV